MHKMNVESAITSAMKQVSGELEKKASCQHKECLQRYATLVSTVDERDTEAELAEIGVAAAHASVTPEDMYADVKAIRAFRALKNEAEPALAAAQTQLEHDVAHFAECQRNLNEAVEKRQATKAEISRLTDVQREAVKAAEASQLFSVVGATNEIECTYLSNEELTSQ